MNNKKINLAKHELEIIKKADKYSDIELLRDNQLNPELINRSVFYTVKIGNGIGIYKDIQQFIQAIDKFPNPVYHIFTDMNSATYWMNHDKYLVPSSMKGYKNNFRTDLKSEKKNKNGITEIWYAIRCKDNTNNVLIADDSDIKLEYKKLKSENQDPVFNVFFYKKQAQYFLNSDDIYKSAGWKNQKQIESLLRHLNTVQKYEDNPDLRLPGYDLNVINDAYNRLDKNNMLITEFIPDNGGMKIHRKAPFAILATVSEEKDSIKHIINTYIFNNPALLRKKMKFLRKNYLWDVYILENNSLKLKQLMSEKDNQVWNKKMRQMRLAASEYLKKVNMKISDYKTVNDWNKQLELYLNNNFNVVKKEEVFDNHYSDKKSEKKINKKPKRHSQQGFISIYSKKDGTTKFLHENNTIKHDDILFDSATDNDLDLGMIPVKRDDE